MTEQKSDSRDMTRAPIYLDYQATTPIDRRVLDAMMPYLTDHFGNPHSSTHAFGWRAEGALEVAREQVAELIGAKPDEIIFTSGATEANNLIIKGAMAHWGAEKPKMVTVVTEHKCVIESARYCQNQGYELLVLPVENTGLVDLGKLADAVDDRTALVSVMAVNNEIGVIQPLAEIGKIAKKAGALFHSDAAQAFGKIPLNVNSLQLDYMSISGHKTYGPKGIGALYKRSGRPTALAPLFSGGGQEGGLRSGTQAPALVAGLGHAAMIAASDMLAEQDRLKTLMHSFKSTLFAGMPGLILNGDETQRWVGNLNISFPGIDGDLLLSKLRNIAVSSGAACASAVAGPSYVLEAIGCSRANAKSAIRIGIGRFTTAEELDIAAETILTAIAEIGGLKP